MRSTLSPPVLETLAPFDSCMTLGEFAWSASPARITGSGASRHLDRYGIREALVHHQHARVVHPPRDGNRRLMEEIRGNPRLHPVWVLEPPRHGGRKACRGLVGEMRDAGVRAARLLLRARGLLPWVWSDLCAELERRRVVTFCDFGGVSTLGEMTDHDVRGLDEIAEAHPRLPLVVSHVMGGLGVHPALETLVRRRRGVRMDITGIMDFSRRVALDVGPEKVLFATGAPFTDAGILAGVVQYEPDLDVSARKRIYGDNLREMLEEVR